MVDYFKAALSQSGGKVFAANSHPYASALAEADGGFIVPELTDPSYLNTILSICRQFEIKAVISLFDLELPILANAREQFAKEGIQILVSSPQVIEICNDKWKTSQFLETAGLHAPKTYVDLQSAIQALKEGRLRFPLFIKPRWGMGSIGLLEAQDESELSLLYARAERIIHQSYLSSESARTPGQMVVIQEKLNGQEYGLDVVNDLDGNYIATFVKKKIAMRSGETDVAITEDNPELVRLGETLAKHLGHIANLDVDVFLTSSGPYVLELNPRFGGGYPFSHLAGADLPAAIVAWLQGQPSPREYVSIRPNVLGIKGVQPLALATPPMDFTNRTV
jgi:carbamoyl-phosphate synthase large subunit